MCQTASPSKLFIPTPLPCPSLAETLLSQSKHRKLPCCWSREMWQIASSWERHLQTLKFKFLKRLPYPKTVLHIWNKSWKHMVSELINAFSWTTSFSWNVVVILFLFKILVKYSVSLQCYTLFQPFFDVDTLTSFNLPPQSWASAVDLQPGDANSIHVGTGGAQRLHHPHVPHTYPT